MDIKNALYREAVKARVKNLFARFDEIKDGIIKKNGGTFVDAIDRIATQKNWKRKDKSDVYGDCSDVNLCNGFGGTDEGVVFRNFMHYLNLFQSEDQVMRDIDLFVLQKAIKESDELKAFVRAIISAAKFVESVKIDDYNDSVDDRIRNNLDPGRNPARHPEYFQSHHMEEKIFPVEKIVDKKTFIKALNEDGVEEVLRRLSGGKLRLGNQYYLVDGPDLIRQRLSKFGLWTHEDKLTAGITPERNEELVAFCSRKE